LKDVNLKTCLIHARHATANCGEPENNINNHPFISNDEQKILIHNGIIEKSEYNLLKEEFPTESDCDSEVLLRYFENNSENTNKSFSKLTGLIPKSQFAICLCEREKEKTKIYLYRNHARPLYFFDMLNITNQIFFCSTVEIFLHALSYYNNSEKIMKECGFYKVSPYKLCELTHEDNSISRKFYSIKLHKEVILEY
jgi:glucosamine 6-phosphate synthetase-like amidotransferase/phosphosugar isomerase protein